MAQCLFFYTLLFAGLSDSLPQHEGPFQLLTLNDNGLFVLNDTALQVLRQYGGPDESVSIVSIVGPYRSGKSYLMNTLAEVNKQSKQVFRVSNLVHPETRGIIMYPYRRKVDGRSDIVLFADTMGLFAPNGTEQGDARLLALTSLFSSVLIYNHIGVPNSDLVKKFRFTVDYAHAIPRESEVDDWREFQADLIWLSRDFFLTIENRESVSINATEWIHGAFVDAGAQSVLKQFRSLKAFTLPAPTRLEDDLKNMAHNPKLQSPKFRQAVARFRTNLFRTARPKRLNKEEMKGVHLANLIDVCVRRMNADEGIQDLDAMKALVQALNQKAIDSAMAVYIRAIPDELPIPEKEIEEVHERMVKQAMAKLNETLYSSTTEEKETNSARLLTNLLYELDSTKLKNMKALDEQLASYVKTEVKNYRASLEQLDLPQHEPVLKKYHSDKVTEIKGKYQTYFDRMELSESKTDDLFTGKLLQCYEDLLQDNSRLSKSVCAMHVGIWNKTIGRKTPYYSLVADFEDDYRAMVDDLKMECRGPSSEGIELKFNYRAAKRKVRIRIRELVEIYKTIFFCFFVLFMTTFVLAVYTEYQYCWVVWIVLGILWAILHKVNRLLSYRFTLELYCRAINENFITLCSILARCLWQSSQLVLKPIVNISAPLLGLLYNRISWWAYNDTNVAILLVGSSAIVFSGLFYISFQWTGARKSCCCVRNQIDKC